MIILTWLGHLNQGEFPRRFNPKYIEQYHRVDGDSHTSMIASQGHYGIKETPEEIDRLIAIDNGGSK